MGRHSRRECKEKDWIGIDIPRAERKQRRGVAQGLRGRAGAGAGV